MKRRDKILCGSIGALGVLAGVVVTIRPGISNIPRILFTAKGFWGLPLMLSGIFTITEAQIHASSQKELLQAAEKFNNVLAVVDSMHKVIYRSQLPVAKERARAALEQLNGKISQCSENDNLKDLCDDVTFLEKRCQDIIHSTERLETENAIPPLSNGTGHICKGI